MLLLWWQLLFEFIFNLKLTMIKLEQIFAFWFWIENNQFEIYKNYFVA